MTSALRRGFRLVALGVVLAVATLTVPDSEVAPTEIALVKYQKESIDIGQDVIWILGVGSDARPHERLLEAHADALQLVGINTRTGAATSIGIPRDSWVNIPGHGPNRINAALALGGPRLQGRVVARLTGIEPDYVLVTGFPGFRIMVNRIGGVTVDNPRVFSDPILRPEGFRTGRVRLRGAEANAFARIRKDLPAGDFDRSRNQQRLLVGILEEVQRKKHRPGFMERSTRHAMRNLHTDLDPVELFKLAQLGGQVDPDKITHCVVPGRVGNVGPASVVFANASVARSYGKQARRSAVLKNC
jgi:LCP family protein required for cell wall assembly